MYAVLSPIGKHKQHHVQAFFDSIAEFDPLPKLVMICTDFDDPKRDLPHVEIPEVLHDKILIFYSTAIEHYGGSLWRISHAREILRKKFLSTGIEWALWIDSDIICPPETPKVLLDVAENESCIMVRNSYPSRVSDQYWQGTGVLLVHRVGMASSLFWYPDQISPHVSEDYVFISILLESGWLLCKAFGFKKTSITGRFVDVTHLK